MRIAVLIPVVVSIAFLANDAIGQPKDGDLVLSMSQWTPTTTLSFCAYLDPTRPGTLTTLATATQGYTFSCLSMAPSNTDMVVGMSDGRVVLDALVSVRPDGRFTTITSIPPFVGEFVLDHDGYWVLLNHASNPGSGGSILGVHHQSGAVTTIYRMGSSSPGVQISSGGLTIDRTSGSFPYAITTYFSDLHSQRTLVTWADRTGKTAPNRLVLGNKFYSVIEHHANSGDYIMGESAGSLCRVTRSGGVTTLTAFVGYAAMITQDDHLWAVGRTPLPQSKPAMLKYDLAQNAVVTLRYLPANHLAGDIEVYGSRRLLCDGRNAQPGGVVAIYLQSRKLGDAGKSYLLACSRDCRPGIHFPHGEGLNLDTTDPLFFTSALGLAPSIFRNFHGVTDGKGNGLAMVDIPRNLPPNLGITIFVAGIIYDKTGVRTVTNTHWFVLP